jgi:hypothetical protein
MAQTNETRRGGGAAGSGNAVCLAANSPENSRIERPPQAQFARLRHGGRDARIVKADRRDALVVLPLRLVAEVATAAERAKS